MVSTLVGFAHFRYHDFNFGFPTLAFVFITINVPAQATASQQRGRGRHSFKRRIHFQFFFGHFVGILAWELGVYNRWPTDWVLFISFELRSRAVRVCPRPPEWIMQVFSWRSCMCGQEGYQTAHHDFSSQSPPGSSQGRILDRHPHSKDWRKLLGMGRHNQLGQPRTFGSILPLLDSCCFFQLIFRCGLSCFFYPVFSLFMGKGKPDLLNGRQRCFFFLIGKEKRCACIHYRLIDTFLTWMSTMDLFVHLARFAIPSHFDGDLIVSATSVDECAVSGRACGVPYMLHAPVSVTASRLTCRMRPNAPCMPASWGMPQSGGEGPSPCREGSAETVPAGSRRV